MPQIPVSGEVRLLDREGTPSSPGGSGYVSADPDGAHLDLALVEDASGISMYARLSPDEAGRLAAVLDAFASFGAGPQT